jgi:hypothetical protein
MEQGPKKPFKLSPQQSAEFLKVAKGADVSQSLAGEEAAESQIGKGPEGRKELIMKAKDMDKFLSAIFEKENIISKANEKLEKDLDLMKTKYATKSRRFNLKLNKVANLEDEIYKLKELMAAEKYSENYLKKNDPKYKDVIEKMEKNRFENGNKLLEIRETIRYLEDRIDLDCIGIINLGKKVKDLLSRGKRIHSN